MMVNKEPNQVQSIIEYLNIPWAIDISEDGKIFFTERDGKLRVITDGTLNPVPVYTFVLPFISSGEGGLMGIALDKDFLTNGYIYLMYTYGEKGTFYNRVVRMRIVGDTAFKEEILLDRIPGGRIHNGGRIKIGPDGYLYITTGDAGIRDLAQDVNSLAGKILRIGTDGSIPPDNPFPGSPVYALGLRNPQGLAWNDKNMLYATDHGETNHDEINLIVPGGNYGWPLTIGYEELKGHDFIQPILQSGDETWAPGGAAFISSGPRKGQLLVSMLRGNGLLAITFDETGTQVVDVEPLLLDTYGRLREVYQASDGSIYLTTSNKDGRGIIHFEDDKILQIAPEI
ncbi:MAG: PQQ-dependent sugar dehydrogenase [Anaerotignum propionicum]|uniref:PQQ-dependent sugar dehydrogenase n=1 Tax=Anaerotignum propionicum TaxID=28446 RepID=UPI002B1F4D5F|nr:PQQ-dependent sugar dehydrogenase [Anaerotignum propionicum]MEA5056148.1 PQQ-dependent sugar dehydrogenase [Anaerotignum propionicum]